MGVTTAIIGNCGFTIAPCKPQHRDLNMLNLTKVEGMPYNTLKDGNKVVQILEKAKDSLKDKIRKKI